VNAPDSRAAAAALDTARAAVDRLGASRHAEDTAADLLEAWSAVEQMLRARLDGGGSGVALVREARQRKQLTFEQANALAALAAAADRVRDTAYRPSEADAEAARKAIAALSTSAPEPPGPPPLPPLEAMTPPGMRQTPLGSIEMITDSARNARARRRVVTAVVVVLAAIGGGLYYWFGGPRRAGVMAQGMSLYEAGALDSAAAVFRRVVLMDPNYALSHVFLGRIAWRQGNLAGANQELQLAITADPGNPLALREMGAYLFATGNYELARKFYVRAVEADPLDPASQGYLGCDLVKLGRIDEGERWITRAGPGAWTACVSGATPPDTLH
jgi:tetratricopeptide (TPR) repeat protein